jgi:hypothetical protein
MAIKLSPPQRHEVYPSPAYLASATTSIAHFTLLNFNEVAELVEWVSAEAVFGIPSATALSVAPLAFEVLLPVCA